MKLKVDTYHVYHSKGFCPSVTTRTINRTFKKRVQNFHRTSIGKWCKDSGINCYIQREVEDVGSGDIEHFVTVYARLTNKQYTECMLRFSIETIHTL